jgi:N,N'-diacetyllegionaminate synthase
MVENSFFGQDKPVFIIAEVGINHNGSLNEALTLVEAAKKSGASAVKFQTYITDRRTEKNSPIYDILKKCELSNSSFNIINEKCKELNIEFFSTPFDQDSFYFLESMNVNLYKLASFDIQNIPLMNLLSNSDKNIIFSTGMSSIKEIDSAINILKQDSSKIGILHCISSYPTPDYSCRLSNIKFLNDRYSGYTVGYSDHSKGINIPVHAVASGAKIIEKHFKLNNDHECVDKAVSIGQDDFTNMVNAIKNVEKIFGVPEFGIRSEEKEIVQYRRTSI